MTTPHLRRNMSTHTWKEQVGGEVIIDVYDPYNLTFLRTEEGVLLKVFESSSAGFVVLDQPSGRHVYCVG